MKLQGLCLPFYVVKLVAMLCRMADLGMNIVTVIHQPRYSVFSLFHEVLLLGKAGRTVFQVSRAVAWSWQAHNSSHSGLSTYR